MTSAHSHEQHLQRHLQLLQRTHKAAKLDELLTATGLRLVDGSLQAGQAVSCARYLKEVERVLGETAFSFARANFILAGCEAARH